MSYEDAVTLCLRIFCSVDNVPERLHRECNKEDLAIVFSELYRDGVVVGSTACSVLYGANYHSCCDREHWVEVLASIFKLSITYDQVRAQELIRKLGHSNISGSV